MSDKTMLLKTPTCTNCKKPINTTQPYECLQGHEICSLCKAKLTRCLICLKSISEMPFYSCMFRKYGCNYKAFLDETRTHETDCDYKGFLCPFEECKWYEIAKEMEAHVRDLHKERTVFSDILEGELPTKDEVLVIVAHEKVFKFYFWIYEFSVDWIVKLIGPQRYSELFTFVLKLYGADNKLIFKNACPCVAWNNLGLEKCATLSVKYLEDHLAKGTLRYSLKIIRNHPMTGTLR